MSRSGSHTYYTLDTLSLFVETSLTHITPWPLWACSWRWVLHLLHLGHLRPVRGEGSYRLLHLLHLGHLGWACKSGPHTYYTLGTLGPRGEAGLIPVTPWARVCRSGPYTPHLFHLGQLRTKIHKAGANEFDVHDVPIKCLRPPKAVGSRGLHVSSPRCQSQGLPKAESTSHRH